MKFNCGPTKEEKRQKLRDRFCNWHRWFAWFPVRVGSNDCRWLETVERRFERVSSFDGEPKEPSYRAPLN